MNYQELELKGVYLLKPTVFGDNRGYFFESYKQEEFNQNVKPINFIQENESKSSYGVLRGLHFQKGEAAQSKLIRCLNGKILDVIVDLRPDSETYGKHLAVELSDENKFQLFIPKHFAHGFLVLSETAQIAYKVDYPYTPQEEAGIAYNDPKLNINWPLSAEKLILSDRDTKWPNL